VCVLPEEVCLRQKTGLGALRLHDKNRKDSVCEDANSYETAVSKLRWKCTTRMTHMELYRTLAASSGATQPGEAPSSTQSTHTAANADLERSDDVPVEEPLESSQGRSRGDSCNPRSLR
jgi:hypothetical protein